MTVVESTQLATQVFACLAAAAAAIGAFRTMWISRGNRALALENKERIQEIHVMVNNRLTQFIENSAELLLAKEKESFASGHAAGKAEAESAALVESRRR